MEFAYLGTVTIERFILSARLKVERMKYFLPMLILLWSPILKAEDSRCIDWDGVPIPFETYFKYDTGIDPNFNHGAWSHRYTEPFEVGLNRLANTVADYQNCLAKHIIGKGEK